MNIHFSDKNLFEQLKRATIAKVKVGSHMYGTNNKNSDVDYLYVYATSYNELHSCFNVHHQLQYIEDGVDHNFVSLHSFIKNCISGDSTINFEVIHSDELKGTELEWLTLYKKSFITYSVIRSYLGLARRDIKHFFRYADEYNKRKRLGHVVRGYIYARDMLNDKFDFELCNLEFKRTNLDVSSSKMLKEYESKISGLRDILNKKFADKTLGLAKNFDVKEGCMLDADLRAFTKSAVYKIKQEQINNIKLDMFINSFENWVEYE